MSVLRRIGRFLRRLVRPGRSGRADLPTDSLADTADDALHMRGRAGGAGFSGTSEAYDHVAEGHERYVESFEDEES